MRRAIIMRGAPGSGKSTLARAELEKLLAEGVPAEIISADDLRLNGRETISDDAVRSKILFDFILGCEYSVDVLIVDDTNTTPVELAPYVAVAGAFGYTVEIRQAEAPAAVCSARNARSVPFEVIEKMIENLNQPLPERWPAPEVFRTSV